MAESIVFNNATYIIPDPGESNWGQNLTNYFVAIPQGAYQLSGGTKALTADLSFGSNFGIFAKYFTSVTATPATAGVVRLAKTDAVEWMNNAGGGNLALAINASDQLTFNGNIIPTDAAAVTAKSFLYGDAAGLIASTSNPTNGKLLIGSTGAIPVAATLTGTANEVIVTNGAGTITLSTPQDIGTASSPTFDHVTLAKTTSQIILGTTNTTTLSATAPASSRVYTFPDAGGSANVVLDAGNYTIGGTWTFSNSITLASSKAVVLTDDSTHTVTVKATNSTTSWTFNLPTTAGSNNFVLKTDGSGNTSWVAQNAGTVSSVAMTVPAFLSIAGSPVTTTGTLAVTLSGTALPAANGGTGQTALSAFVPTIQKFTSSSGTYTTPAGCTWIKVLMVGGGGGGAGGGTAAGSAAGVGGNSTFGTTLLVANGGGAGVFGANSAAGGTASLGSGPIGVALSGGLGQAGGGVTLGSNTAVQVGGNGSSSPFGGAGAGGSQAVAGSAAIANTGSGGGGGATSSTASANFAGGGGAAGGYVAAIITSPAGSYAYAVGAVGTAGGAGTGTNAGAGGAGGSGIIIVEEHYI